MKTAARFSLERIAALDRAVRAGEYPNANTIARRLEVSHRTVQRDVEFLRDRLGAPLEFDPVRNGYFYRDPLYRLAFLELSEAEVVTLCEAEQILAEMYRGTPLAAGLARTFRKLTAGLTDRVRVGAGPAAPTRSFRLTARASLDPELFRTLDALILARGRVALRYWSASRDEETLREVDPYHLASVDGQWFLVAYCHLRGDVRMFVPGRIRALEPTGATFEPPADFRIDEYLSRSFAVMRGGPGESYRVRLRFAGAAARYVRERTWHPSQRLEPEADGGVVLSMEVGHLREVERFALSWMPDVEVLDPPELRDRITSQLTEALSRHRP